MTNFIEDAFPSTVSYSDESPELLIRTGGFTKLEYASLLIAQGLATLRDQHGQPYYSPDVLAIDSVKYAKSVLEESNK